MLPSTVRFRDLCVEASAIQTAKRGRDWHDRRVTSPRSQLGDSGVDQADSAQAAPPNARLVRVRRSARPSPWLWLPAVVVIAAIAGQVVNMSRPGQRPPGPLTSPTVKSNIGTSGLIAHCRNTGECANLNFHGVFIGAINLRGADFDRINAKGAVFEQTSLAGSSFRGADLRGASFVGADLRGTTFAGSCLRGVVFRDDNLAGADFSRANVEGVWILNSQRLAIIGWKLTNTGKACSHMRD